MRSDFYMLIYLHTLLMLSHLSQILSLRNILILVSYNFMGSSQSPTTVVIIDENKEKEVFNEIVNDERFHVIYYTDYDKFLQNQSLKHLSFIIIRQKIQKDSIIQYENSLAAKTKDNRREFDQMFGKATSKKTMTLKERLITYIRKYSLEKLVLYVFVQDVLKFRLPDYEVPYVTLVADKIEVIKDNILSNPQREEPFDFKFRRMVKDLYKRTTIKIVCQKKEEAEWGEFLIRHGLSHNFSNDISSFKKQLISNFSQYIAVNSKKMLQQILIQKKKRKLQSKIIFLGSEDAVLEERRQIWMVNQGKTPGSKERIAKTIKNCTDKMVDQETLISQNTIIFTNLQYTQNEKQYIKVQVIEKLRKKQSKNIQNQAQIDNLHLQIVSSYDHLKEKLITSVFSYIITFDCLIPDIQQLKQWIRTSKLNYRVYIYSVQQKSEIIDKIMKDKQVNPEAVKSYLNDKIKQIIENASFKIKFEISPIDSITTYRAKQKELKHLTSKMGLITTNIEDLRSFTEKYLSRNREQFIESYHLICRYEDYQKDLSPLLNSQIQMVSQKIPDSSKPKASISRDSYFSKIKIIIFDDKERIRKNWDKISNDKKIVFAHFNLSHIDDYLDNVFTSKVAVSFFVKKSLPKFFDAIYKIQNNIAENIFSEIKMTSSIVSKNQLLKEVFNDDNFKMSTEYDQSFYKFSSQAHSNPDFSAFLKSYCNLWRVGYKLIKDPQNMQDCINALKEDIKRCLFKCKSYDLIDVSDEQFEYFYLNRLDSCQTFIDLQVAVIYIFSLPHGFFDIFQNIFKNPFTTCLTPKIFSSYLVTLLTTFVSFEDQVMGKKRLVVYVADKDIESIMSGINKDETLYNTCFLLCGKDQNQEQNSHNNCLFFQFQDVPMLDESRIKSCLFIERFSFYKGSAEYLIAPYTQFTVKEKQLKDGKYHIVLTHQPKSQQKFINSILKNNDVDEEMLFLVIKDEISSIQNSDFEKQEKERINNIKSLYKKAELISLYEQKLELVKSIKQGFEYRNFLRQLQQQHYLSALSHIYKKETIKKSTSQLQAQYFKNMLGVQKSYLFFKMCEYHLSAKELQKVILFLQDQVMQTNEKSVLQKIKLYKQNIQDIINKKIGALDEEQKAQKRLQKSREMIWRVKYLQARQQFYIETGKMEDKIILPFHIDYPFSQPKKDQKDYPYYSKTTLDQVHQQDQQRTRKSERKNTCSKGKMSDRRDEQGKGKSPKSKSKSKQNNAD